MQNSKFKIKNVFTVSALALVLVALGSLLWMGISRVQAATQNQPVVDKLVERFNLNKDEVIGVFDEVRQEKQQQMLTAMGERLDEAVNDGVITTEQKQALLNKHQEMWEKQNQLREEMQTWMEQSGIDFEKLAPYRVVFGGRGCGRGHPFGGF